VVLPVLLVGGGDDDDDGALTVNQVGSNTTSSPIPTFASIASPTPSQGATLSPTRKPAIAPVVILPPELPPSAIPTIIPRLAEFLTEVSSDGGLTWIADRANNAGIFSDRRILQRYALATL
jgi:hypothetical protein